MNYTANYQVHGLSKVAGVGTELWFGSQIPLNKASTTCSKNDGCWLQSLCFSANNLPRIPFNNTCLGMDLAKFPNQRHTRQFLMQTTEKKQNLQDFTNMNIAQEIVCIIFINEVLIASL
jgi:lipopolysaccharide biosynthesis glycosyltransferase